MKYVIAIGEKIHELSAEVNSFINQGYKPHGSMATVVWETQVKLLQPMIKE